MTAMIDPCWNIDIVDVDQWPHLPYPSSIDELRLSDNLVNLMPLYDLNPLCTRLYAESWISFPRHSLDAKFPNYPIGSC